MKAELEEAPPNFKTADELSEYVNALGNLALTVGQQNNFLSEEDQKDILQLIEIMENEPERLPSDFNVAEVKDYYDGVFKMKIANEYMHLVTVQMVFNMQNRGKKKKLN